MDRPHVLLETPLVGKVFETDVADMVLDVVVVVGDVVFQPVLGGEGLVALVAQERLFHPVAVAVQHVALHILAGHEHLGTFWAGVSPGKKGQLYKQFSGLLTFLTELCLSLWVLNLSNQTFG